jgi:hypothetical protein
MVVCLYCFNHIIQIKTVPYFSVEINNNSPAARYEVMLSLPGDEHESGRHVVGNCQLPCYDNYVFIGVYIYIIIFRNT